MKKIYDKLKKVRKIIRKYIYDLFDRMEEVQNSVEETADDFIR